MRARWNACLLSVTVCPSVRQIAGLVAALVAALVIGLCQSASAESLQQRPGLGTAVNPAQLASMPVPVTADGSGLPAGSGTATVGEQVFNRQCAACHGPEGRGGSAMELIGDRSLLDTEYPDRGIAVYWPYAPPLFDYIRRAMPPSAPYSLAASDVYAVIAYLFEKSDLLSPGTTLDGNGLAAIVMPNRDNFSNNTDHTP